MRVRLTAIARTELDAILAAVRRESPLGARRITKRMKELRRALADPPRPGRPTEKPNVRIAVLRSYPYLVFFEIRHRARDPATMPGTPTRDPAND